MPNKLEIKMKPNTFCAGQFKSRYKNEAACTRLSVGLVIKGTKLEHNFWYTNCWNMSALAESVSARVSVCAMQVHYVMQ